MLLDDTHIIILTSCPNPIMVLTEDTSLVFVNHPFEELTGFSSAELIGQKIPYPWWRNEELHEITRSFYEAIKNGSRQEKLFQAKDGRLFWVRIGTTKLTMSGEPKYIVCNYYDITAERQAEETVKKARDELESRVIERTAELMSIGEKLSKQIAKRKRIEKELIRSQEQLRTLYTHLQSLREEDRTVLSREVHDNLGQALTALHLYASWVYEHLPKEQEKLSRKIKEMLKIIDSTIKTVKRISTELRPGLLDDLGIVAAIEWQVKTFQDNTNIKYEIHSNIGEINLDKEQNTVIFRILQEALTNVIRHAKATMVKVLLNEKNGNLVLTVKDNGIGITKEQIDANMSLGLQGMRERVRSFHGELKIKGVQGHGTTVIASIPLDIRRE